MRTAYFLTGAALALALPAIAQTDTTMPQAAPAATPTPSASPTASRTPMPSATPASPTPMATPTPTGMPGPMTPSSTTAPTTATTGTVTAAPTVVNPAVGVRVFDPAGTEVGTIKAMDAQYATIETAKGEVKLPAAGVGPGPNGAAVGLTAAQIDAAVAQAAPAQPAADATATETKTTTKSTTRRTRRR